MSEYRLYQSQTLANGRYMQKKWASLSNRKKEKLLSEWARPEMEKQRIKKILDGLDLFAIGVLSTVLSGDAERIEGHLSWQALELLDLTGDGTTVFPEDAELVVDFCKAKFKIEGESLHHKWGIFSFSPPSGLVVDGVEIRPFLFAKISLDCATKAMLEVTKKIGLDLQFAAPPLLGNVEVGRISISPRSADSGIDYYKAPWDKLVSDLNDPKASGLDCVLLAHLRVALALLVYVECFPLKVIQEYPGGANERELRLSFFSMSRRDARKCLTLQVPRNRQGVREHLRSKCFVTYRHPSKCKKTGGKPWIGQRRGCTVNKKTTPYTVVA